MLAARWFGGEMTENRTILGMCAHGISLPMNLISLSTFASLVQHLFIPVGSLSNYYDDDDDNDSVKNDCFYDQNNISARASPVLVLFFDVHCTTSW